MALSNVTQLKEVLDAIYQDAQSPDRYSGDEKNGITLYYNKMESEATIFKYTENGLESVIAIFDPKVVAYTDQELIEFYSCKQMNDGTIRSSGLDISGRGLGTYIGLKTMIRNCLAFLGVGTDEDFDSKNPVIYNDMVNIVHKYTDELEDNVEGYWGKYSDNDVVSYRPYIPVLIILDLAIYLNSFNFFEQQIKLYNVSLNINWTGKYGTAIDNLVCKFSDFYQTLDKDTFFSNFEKCYYNFFRGEYSNRFIQAFNTFKNIYGNSINFNNISLLYVNLSGGIPSPPGSVAQSNPSYVSFRLDNFTTDCFLYGGYHGGTSYYVGNGKSYCNVVNRVSNYINRRYIVRLDWDNEGNVTITNNIIETEVQKDTVVEFSITFSNIDCNIYYKTYNEYSVASGTYPTTYYNLSYFGILSNNTFYGRDQLHFTDKRALSVIDYYLYQVLTDNNVDISSDDLAIYINYNSTIFLCLFKNVNILKSNRLHDFCSAGTSANIVTNHIYNSYANRHEYYDYAVISGGRGTINSYTFYNSNSDCVIDFDRSTQMYIYKLTYTNENTYNFELYASDNSDSFNMKSYFDTTRYRSLSYFWTNLGELTELNEVEFDGMYLLEGATYPRSINTITQFKTLYNNAIYRGINNPYFTDGELNDHLINWEYVNCSVSKTPPDNQADAQDFDLDDLSDDEVADIIKDIDKASGDDDSPEDDVPPNEEGFEEEGNSPAPEPIDNLAEPLDFGMFKMYVLTRAQAVDVGHNLAAADFWSFADKFFNNPIDSIISLQSTNVITANDSTSVVEAVQINGKTLNNPAVTARRLTKSKSEIDLGYIEIPAKYNNYLDITNTKMKIYLPFVGFVDLNIAEFVGGGINLWARIDHYTGDIVYFIYSSRNDLHRCVATAQGNSQKQIPLTSNNFMRFFQGLLGGSK